MSQFIDNSAKVLVQIRKNISEALQETSVRIVDDMAASFGMQKHGRFYGTHQASAPGEAPAIFEGDLLNSLSSEKIDDLEYRQGSNDKKALGLELGTSKISPRPFLMPATMKNADEMKRKIKNKISK